jgi:hypothetical protein
MRAGLPFLGNNILDESSPASDNDLDEVVREIYRILASPYWDDDAHEIETLIRAYCERQKANRDSDS